MINLILLLNSDWVLLFVRVVLGVVLIYSGVSKIRDLKLNAKKPAKGGFMPDLSWETFAAFVEFFGGAAIFLGIWAEIAALIITIQAVANIIWRVVKLKTIFADWYYDLMLFTISLVIITFGPGPYSLLHLF